MLRVVRQVQRLLLLACAVLFGVAGQSAVANAQTFNLRVRYGGPGFGRGTVTSSPAGIDCAFVGKADEFAGTGTCDASFPSGTSVVLSVSPKDGSTFSGWLDDCSAFTTDCTVVMDRDRSARPVLIPAKAKVTVQLRGNGTGSVVQISPSGGVPSFGCSIAKGVQASTCEADYPIGSRVSFEIRISPSSPTTARFDVPPCVDAFLCNAVVNAPLTVTAAFNNPIVHVSGAGTGSGRVVGDAASGIDCALSPSGSTGTCTRVYESTSRPLTTLTPVPDEGSFFVGWSGLCSGSSQCATAGGYPPNGEVVARFDAQPAGITSLFLTSAGGYGRARVTSIPAGVDCDFSDPAKPEGTGTCRGDFPVNTTVQLIATPRDGTKVLGFVGDCVATSETCTLSMFHDRRVTVQLDPARFPVTIVGAGTGSGGVTGLITPITPRIDCVITAGATSGTCSTMYPFGSIVILGAASFFETTFGGYSSPPCVGPGCNAAVTGPMTITATFNGPAPASGTLTVSGAGNGSGTVQSAPAGLTCTIASGVAGAGCAAVFALGTTVSLTPVASAGSRFVGWEGDCSGSSTCLVTVVDPRSVVARFTQDPSAIALTIAGGGTGNGVVAVMPGGAHCKITGGGVVEGVGCSITFSQSVDITLTAEPQFGSSFGGWGGACDNTEPACSFTLSSSRTVIATFLAPHSAQDLTLALVGRFQLTPAERAELDRLGNNNGQFDLGDVLAYLDRTGQRASSAAPAVSSKPQSSTAPAAKPRRVP